MASSFYLIVEPIDIIATDLGLSVQDYDGTATVGIAKTLEEALTILADRQTVHVAFVHADPVSFAETELGVALALRGTQCVFMGDAAEHAKRALIVLDRPFSPQTIAALLQSLIK